jgi:superfamily II DNA or RNA helicase
VSPGYKPSSIVEKILANEFIDVNKFNTLITLKKIQIPLTTNIYSYLASRTQFHAIQFKPLIKFLNSNYYRILIADEVGVGKTIEAGIIYTEMKARLKHLEKVMVICPSYLLQRKWQDELQSRFDEFFPILNGEQFISHVKDWPNQKHFRGIISLPLLRLRKYIDLIVKHEPDFDLIIIDEAHHFRNQTTQTYQLGELLSSLTNIMIFLTATPIHISNANLYNLLHLLIPQEFADGRVFNIIIEPNKYINESISKIQNKHYHEAYDNIKNLENLALKDRFVNNPIYEEIKSVLTQDSEITREDRVKLVNNLHELNTLGHVVTRTKKRDFPEQFPIREPHVIKVDFENEELDFYNAVYQYARNRSKRLSEQGYEIPFLTIMVRRRAASCLQALNKYFVRILQIGKYISNDEDDEIDAYESDHYSKKELEDFSRLTEDDIEEIKELVELGRNLGNKDAKFNMFIKSINELFDKGVRKILVFSYFKDTLNYLKENILHKNRNLQVGIIHGDIALQDRESIIDEFRKSSENYILLSSEVGGEGLDMQFCSCMFNYDLPWNPMRIEQRIGRLDRLGQKEKKVLIYNFSVKDTIEEIILERLYQRIEIFKESLGDLEEILGEELNGIRDSIFNVNLTKNQVERELERIAYKIIEKQRINESFDKEREKILGQDDYFSEQVTRIGEEKKFVTGGELENLFIQFVKENFPESKLKKKSKKSDEYHFRLNKSLQDYLIRNIVYRYSSVSNKRSLASKIRNPKGFALTFSQKLACQNKEIEFASVNHPITQSIYDFYRESINHRFVSKIKCNARNFRKGIYYFVIYFIKISGYTESYSLFPTVVNTSTLQIDQNLSDSFFSIDFKNYDDNQFELGGDNLQNYNRIAMAEFNSHCEKLREKLDSKNRRLIDIRISSIKQTNDLLINHIEEQLKKHQISQSDERIIRMKKRQKENLLFKMETQLEELEKKKEISIETDPVSGGILVAE